MLLVDHVHKSFGKLRAVRGVTFEIPRGQVVGLLGPNGAGKTTTIRMVTGYTPPDAGRVVIDGKDMTHAAAEARRQIGYLPESAPLYLEMTVRDYLGFRAKLYGLSRSERRTALGNAIERCWLKDVTTRRIGQLSKGFKQRVGLAGALLHGPQVLVLDEPTNGLDPTQVGETRSLIRELGATRTLLISSHVLTEIERLCDRVIVLAGGEIRADGPPRTLIEQAPLSSPYLVEIELQSTANALPDVIAMAQKIVGVVKVSGRETSGDSHASDHPVPCRWAELTITPSPSAGDLRESIARAARSGGLLIRSLQRQTPNLEQLFIDLIERHNSSGGRV